MKSKTVERLGPSSPKQAMMLRNETNLAVWGGAAGSGKSYMALMAPLKYKDDPYFRGIIFRRTTAELTAQGGLWENACELYKKVFGENNPKLKIRQKEMKITFPSGASIKFSYMENDQDRLKHTGAQYSWICFDEANHFSQIIIEHLRGRMRSARAKHPLQMVLTCNPDPDWFALDWIKPYLLPDGTPDRSKDGQIRYYIMQDNQYVWADTIEELEERYGGGEDSGIQSFTFISANCEDNIPLLQADRAYLSRLKALPYVEMQRLLYGNWFVRPTGSTVMERGWFNVVDREPAWNEIVKTVRAFDFAGSTKSDKQPSPDYTACVKMSKLKDGNYFIHDVQRIRIKYGDWVKFILDCCKDDTGRTDVIIPIDPNPAAAAASSMLAKELSEHGLYVRRLRASGKKLDRVRPFASMLMNGGVSILANCGTDHENGIYNDLSFFFREVDAFDGLRRSGELGHDDMVDALSDSYSVLANKTHIPNFTHALQAVDLTQRNVFD